MGITGQARAVDGPYAAVRYPRARGAVVQRGLVTIDPFFVFSRRTVRCSGSARAGEDAVPGVMKWRRKHTVVGDIIQFINPS